MSRSRNGFGVAVLLAFCNIAINNSACAVELSRGHKILMQKGFQLQAMVSWQGCNRQTWLSSNFTTVLGSALVPADMLSSWPPTQWARVGETISMYPNEANLLPNMVNFTYHDEIQLCPSGWGLSNPSSIEYWNQINKDLNTVRNLFTGAMASICPLPAQDRLPYTNELKTIINTVKPDMYIIESYPFGDTAMSFYPNNTNVRKPCKRTQMYRNLQRGRKVSLAGVDGKPIPYGSYIQICALGGQTHVASESELRLNQFSLWTFGYKMAAGYYYQESAKPTDVGDHCFLFNNYTPTAAFYQEAETNRQSLNIGKALNCLLSTDVRAVPGTYRMYNDTSKTWVVTQDAGLSCSWDGFTWQEDSEDAVPVFDSTSNQYIKSISATNLSVANSGNPGDVLIGFFRPLENDGVYGNETYFMVLNGLCDPNSSAGETRQRVNIQFDFTGSAINSLQRLSRLTGQVENVPLTYLGNSKYSLTLDLDGGTGDLFKFNTGVPFAGSGVAEVSYQGRLTNKSDAPLPDGTRYMTFAFYNCAEGGSAISTSDSIPVKTLNGYFKVNVPVSSADGLLISPCWMEINVNGDVLKPRVRVYPVPAARKLISTN